MYKVSPSLPRLISLDVLYHALTSLTASLCFHIYQLRHSKALFVVVDKSLGDLLICCRQTVDSCLALYFTNRKTACQVLLRECVRAATQFTWYVMYTHSNDCGSLVTKYLHLLKTLFMHDRSINSCGFTWSKSCSQTPPSRAWWLLSGLPLVGWVSNLDRCDYIFVM